MRMILAIMLLAPVAGAEIINCGPTVNHRELALRGHDLTFRVEHPFHVFLGKVVKASGSLLVNPQNLGEGIMVRVKIPRKGLYSTNPRIQPMLTELGSGRGARLYFEFLSRTMEILPRKKHEPLKVKLWGELVHEDRKKILEVPSECVVEDEYFRCRIRMSFGLTDFKLPSPQKAFVWARNEVTVYGDITFGPQQEQQDGF